MEKKKFNPFCDSDFLISRKSRKGSDNQRYLCELNDDELVQLRNEIDVILKEYSFSQKAENKEQDMEQKTFKEILRMVEDACGDVFYSGAKGQEKAVIDCAAKIYIAQMNLNYKKQNEE